MCPMGADVRHVLKTKAKADMKDEYDFAEIVDVSSTEQPGNLNECENIGTF